MPAPELKRLLIAVLVGGLLGFGYHKLVGCRTGACPLIATPWRAIAYGAVMGALFSLSMGRRP